ncbi:hypothetical protein LWI28_014858 [Acer negundo]|uniref:Uncharacterized protein n=1 Tax=Acer negundo TaxID=4023 RepID=A0AAD5NUP9_ACENE|nr:hypothetical protein LWI28_014858 [Acer negundo]
MLQHVKEADGLTGIESGSESNNGKDLVGDSCKMVVEENDLLINSVSTFEPQPITLEISQPLSIEIIEAQSKLVFEAHPEPFSSSGAALISMNKEHILCPPYSIKPDCICGGKRKLVTDNFAYSDGNKKSRKEVVEDLAKSECVDGSGSTKKVTNDSGFFR